MYFEKKTYVFQSKNICFLFQKHMFFIFTFRKESFLITLFIGFAKEKHA